MKAVLIVTDASGNNWELELPLRSVGNPAKEPTSAKARRRTRKIPAETGISVPQPGILHFDLSLPIRPFMTRYARGANGAQKFALLVAYIAKGNLTSEVLRSEVEKQWSKMKGILGNAFNPAFSTRAKDKGWVDSPKFGVYKLLADWEKVLADAGQNG